MFKYMGCFQVRYKNCAKYATRYPKEFFLIGYIYFFKLQVTSFKRKKINSHRFSKGEGSEKMELFLPAVTRIMLQSVKTK